MTTATEMLACDNATSRHDGVPATDATIVRRSDQTGWSVKTVSMLLAHRLPAAIILGAAAVVLISGRIPEAPLYRCPFKSLTELPCPGCGLSRAGWLLLTGRFRAMWQLHPFAPYLAVWGVMLAGAAFLPDALRQRWVKGWVALERYTKLHAIFLIGITLFGVARFLGKYARSL